MTRAVIYLRVNTAARSDSPCHTDAVTQEIPLRELITQRGWQFVKAYSDRACGGKERRPGLYSLLQDARRGAFDVVVFSRFDRIARSLKHLIATFALFRKLGIDVASLSERFDSTTVVGAEAMGVLAAMANIDRDLRIEQIRAGIEFALLHGSKSGRPIGRPRLTVDSDRIVELRREGRSWPKIAAELRVSPTTVRRVWAGASPESHGQSGGLP